MRRQACGVRTRGRWYCVRKLESSQSLGSSGVAARRDAVAKERECSGGCGSRNASGASVGSVNQHHTQGICELQSEVGRE